MVSRFSSVGELPRDLARALAGEGMLDVGEVGTDADQPPTIGAAKTVAQQVGAGLQRLGVLARPTQQVAQPVERRLLRKPRRADRGRSPSPSRSRWQPGVGRHTADTVAGEREHLGEAVEVDQRAAPARVR